ncbi:uncharacterized protein LOC144025426 isoform X2 [Festucalex cinctus]
MARQTAKFKETNHFLSVLTVCFVNSFSSFCEASRRSDVMNLRWSRYKEQLSPMLLKEAPDEVLCTCRIVHAMHDKEQEECGGSLRKVVQHSCRFFSPNGYDLAHFS